MFWRSLAVQNENTNEDYSRPSCMSVAFLLVLFSPTKSLTTPVKSLKEAHSDVTIRSHFNNRSDAFSTPSSTPETPSSWPPRPVLTGLSPTCVANHSCLVLIHFLFSIPFRYGCFEPFWNHPLPIAPLPALRPPRKLFGVALKTIRRMVSIFVFSFEPSLSNRPFSHFGKIPQILEWVTYILERVT